MDQQFNSSNGLHLPQPSSAGGSVPNFEPLSAVPASQATPTNPLPVQPATGAGSGQMHTTSAYSGDQADDLDREWIAKAKRIVEETKHDPYLQSKEIGKAKADYLRIRFNKHIKVGPEQTL